MSKYLSPTIATVISQLEQTCDDLTRQELIRSLTDYTKRLCESDPELADILSEGKKTLPRCLRYVLEQAQKTVAKKVEAMLEDEFHALDEIQVRGQRALMAGPLSERSRSMNGPGPITMEEKKWSRKVRKKLLLPKKERERIKRRLKRIPMRILLRIVEQNKLAPKRQSCLQAKPDK